ncbi:sialyltransferase [Pycnococcus provasolii]
MISPRRMMLMHVCERVTAYGFTAGKTLKAWYFDKRPKNKNGSHHGKKLWLRNKSWQIDQWRFAEMSPAVDVRKGGGGGGGAR